jgi:cell division protein FtsI/penicillin-binding protein 2
MRIFNQKQPDIERPGWREYQASIQKATGRAKNRTWAAIAATAVAACGLVYMVLASFASTPPEGAEEADVATQAMAEPTVLEATVPTNGMLSKKDVRVLLSQLPPNRIIKELAALPFHGQELLVETSLDMDLQSYLVDSMDLKNSRYIGIVVMEADTGRVLVLAGFDKTDPKNNPGLQNTFPAASIFKIVTSAAAVDQCRYNADTRLSFNGYKHTLYKSQLKDKTNQYTNTISFKNAFAQSVNPVFGKIGALRLGKEKLEQSAVAFGFNQPIDFELPVPASHISIKDNAYHWAEIASGFNNDTVITPLHGAMMAAAVINGGEMPSPSMVDRISDAKGKFLYQTEPHRQGRAMSANAADTLIRMMETTVTSGTGRKVFRGLRRHRTLSHLQIGGKTGSIFNRAHDLRLDWFVGFAKEKKGRCGLAISVLVAHEEYIGRRAGQYARMAMTHFFESQLARHADGKNGKEG